MPSKYDTNQLDPDFPEKAKAAAATAQASAETGGETRPFANTENYEQETREFGPRDFGAYQAPQGAYAPAFYASSAPAAVEDVRNRRVDKVGLKENIVTAIPYIPWYFGLVVGIILLVLLPKSEAKSRFHAAQGLAAHLGILLVTTLLGVVGSITNAVRPAVGIFSAITTIILFVFVYKAWRGRPIHLEFLEGLTDWLEEKLTPDTFNKK
ncbi:MAG: hypothetical protein K1X52_05265 [Pyrinomonadaceae bacterium]|nr:hypothetical protein [Pyrinomonadaceae bacterium]